MQNLYVIFSVKERETCSSLMTKKLFAELSHAHPLSAHDEHDPERGEKEKEKLLEGASQFFPLRSLVFSLAAFDPSLNKKKKKRFSRRRSKRDPGIRAGRQKSFS